MISRRRLFVLVCLVLPVAVWPRTAAAQDAAEAEVLTNGFAVKLDAVATIKEMQKQDNLYVMEVTFKPMRMRWVEVTDPKTGRKSRQLIWYLVYKAVNRKLQRRQEAAETTPHNAEDKVPTPLFVPSFTLVTTDGGVQQIYHDVIIPEAHADILKRERRYPGQPLLKDGVGVVGPLPAPVPEGAKDEQSIYGVATFQGVDPETDFFEVYMSGFSNAFVKKNGLTFRKTIHQKYQRPGDRFFQTEAEIKRDGDPEWIYWPDDVPPKKQPAAKKPAAKKS